jgi:demethylmenaquinone methyltransferase/2-methoxy-6-polyprenyl-1,4-benzoquinol methylase
MVGDMMNPPFPTGTLALVTAGYAFRNVPDFRAALRQTVARLKDGGVLVTLDFYLPTSRLWRALYLAYLRLAGRAIGWLWHRSPIVYEYISHSVRRFVSADDFTREMAAAGLRVELQKNWLGGGIAAHFARRPIPITRSDLP